MLVKDKRSSLLDQFVNYDRRKFYKIVPWSEKVLNNKSISTRLTDSSERNKETEIWNLKNSMW